MAQELTSRIVVRELCMLLRVATGDGAWLKAENEFTSHFNICDDAIHLAYREIPLGHIARSDLAGPLDDVSNLLQPMVWKIIVERAPPEVLYYWSA